MTVIVGNTRSSTTPSLEGSNLLPELAARANRAHGNAGKASKRAVEHAFKAGEALTDARARVGKGNWFKWLKDNCPQIERRRASEYIRIWTHKEQVPGADVGTIALRALIKAVSTKLPKDDADEDDADAESDEEESPGKPRKFNKQTGDGIEWAQWSWNPVTGCLHDCPYCYARDIAERFYPQKFEPTFHADRLAAPINTTVPSEAEADTRYRNVFTCSMADLFGRWVPKEWIVAVLDQVRTSPQWNFLFLTKFPKRMAEFDIPANAWMGTTVDLQARVANAETAFERLKDHAGVRWLSIEPMLEPLKFKRLDLFHWIVIGGASASTKTPEWRPPREWITNLEAQADAAGVAVYEKANLWGHRRLELPFAAPIKADPSQAPSVFHYLGKSREAA